MLRSSIPRCGSRVRQSPRVPAGALVTVVGITGMLACSSGGAKQGAAQAAKAPPIMSACTLLTPAEASEVLNIPQAIARRSPDSLAEAARGESRCVFRAPPGSSMLEMVTVYVENGLSAADQATLNQRATTMGLGEDAQTATGFGVPAATMKEPPTLVAQKGSYLVLVSAPTMEGTKSLGAKAIGRLP
jgi:hypothetical protein